MSMSTHIVGFKVPDDKWYQMKAVWDACRTAKVDPPTVVEKYFEFTSPEEYGTPVQEKALTGILEYRDDMRQGYDIFVDKLPEGVKVVRVYNSY
jgi:hypothetical protein